MATVPQNLEPPPADAMKGVNWQDFRDHLGTADAEGRRLWIYARKPKGRYTSARRWLSVLLIGIMFAGPFIHINGNPLLLMNIVERKFSILGQVFWPQDGAILAFGLLLYLTGIAVFTAAFGRVWCGWTCPQTVMMEMVFRPIEYLIEGDAPAQRALARAPWSAGKLARKLLKHAIFFGLSFVIGNTLLAYIIGVDALKAVVMDDPRNHLTGLTFMLLFTGVFYAIFARFREQACTFICPYGRLQSVLLDENSIVVAYDHQRGERRGKLSRSLTGDQRKNAGSGDCVDCHQCVAVCPTGIDIRNGTQMECVHCTACMDACDAVMDKIRRPRGLIRYASLNGIERGEKLRVTPRIVVYSLILLALGAGLAALLLTRSDVDATLLRAPGALFQQTADGKISNLYQLKVANKTSRDLHVELRLESPEGKLTVFGMRQVPKQQLLQTSVLVELPPTGLKGGLADIVVGVYAEGRRVSRFKTGFIGPRTDLGGR
jgi:cytochrome c oxidase accessory protein FixG